MKYLLIAAVMLLAGCGGGDTRVPEPPPSFPTGWTQTAASAPYGERDAGATAVFNNEIWILNGWRYANGVTTILTDAWHSKDGLTWRQSDPVPWTFGMYGMAGTLNNTMFYMGGLKNSRLPTEEISNEIWGTENGRLWTFRGHAQWAPRIGSTMLLHNGNLWILGGKTKNTGDPVFYRNDVWVSSNGVQWDQVTGSAPWSARAYHCAVSHQGRIWIIGGGDWDAKFGLSDVWSSSDGKTWENHGRAPWEGRIWHACQSYAGKIRVIGGRLFDPIRTVDEIWSTVDGSTWIKSTDVPAPGPRHAPYSAVFDHRLWIMGGSAHGYLHSDAWFYFAPN